MPKLNSHLQPLNAEVSQGNKMPAYKFGIRQKIQSKKIRGSTGSFNNLMGTLGTLTLGGMVNGNGALYVKNTSGSIIITANSSGMEIDNGNLIVKNNNNTTIVDTNGIVSTANFINDEVTNLVTHTTTSTSFVDLPGSTMNQFVLSRTTNALISLEGVGYCSNFDSTGNSIQLQCIDSVNGTIISYPLYASWSLVGINFVAQNWSTSDTDQITNLSVISPLSAGTHTMKLQYKLNQSSGTAIIDTFLLSYILLGS